MTEHQWKEKHLYFPLKLKHLSPSIFTTSIHGNIFDLKLMALHS